MPENNSSENTKINEPAVWSSIVISTTISQLWLFYGLGSYKMKCLKRFDLDSTRLNIVIPVKGLAYRLTHYPAIW